MTNENSKRIVARLCELADEKVLKNSFWSKSWWTSFLPSTSMLRNCLHEGLYFVVVLAMFECGISYCCWSYWLLPIMWWNEITLYYLKEAGLRYFFWWDSHNHAIFWKKFKACDQITFDASKVFIGEIQLYNPRFKDSSRCNRRETPFSFLKFQIQM